MAITLKKLDEDREYVRFTRHSIWQMATEYQHLDPDMFLALQLTISHLDFIERMIMVRAKEKRERRKKRK